MQGVHVAKEFLFELEHFESRKPGLSGEGPQPNDALRGREVLVRCSHHVIAAQAAALGFLG